MRTFSFHSLIYILYPAATIYLLKVNAQINTYRASAELLKEWRGADSTFNGIWDTDSFGTQCSYSRNIGHWIRAKRANETIKRKNSDLTLNAMNNPNDNHNFVGTHECDVLIVMDPNFKAQALNRYQSTHPKETPTDLEAKLNSFAFPDSLAESWSHEQKVLQAYMYETFVEVNHIYARTDFGGVRLKMTPIVMLLDNYCAGNTRSRTLLCGDEIFHHEQKIKALNTLAAIPEIGDSKHCLILFLASRSQCLNHPNTDYVLRRILLNQSSARTELAEIMRTRARIPTIADHNYRGGICDTKKYADDNELNLKRHNIALVENHGVNEDEILENDILHDVIIYRMLTHVVGHNIGANHDHYYDKDQCYEPNLISIMHERIHRIGAMEFYKTTEQFAKCARQYVSQHLRRLQVGHTSKGKSCLKTNIIINYSNNDALKKVQELGKNLAGKYKDVKKVETYIEDLEKTYPLEEFARENENDTVRQLRTLIMSQELKHVFEQVQRTVDASIEVKANDEIEDERIKKSDNPEHSVAGVKLFFYHWYTVQAVKMLANDPNSELNTRVEIIRERLEKDSIYIFENAVRESPKLYKPEKGEKSWLSPIGVEYVNDVWSNSPTKVRLHSISIELNGAKPITVQELRENLKNNASLIEEIRKGVGKNIGLNFAGDMQFIKPDGSEGPPCKGHVIKCLEDAGHSVNTIDADHPPVLVIYAPKKIKTD